MRDLKSELKQWDGRYLGAWNPSPGDMLVGIVKAYSTGTNQYGEVRIATVVNEETGELLCVWLSSTMLLSLFKQQKPKVGERIGLKYAGKHPDKGYKLFSLIVDRAEDEPDFDPLGGEQIDSTPAGDIHRQDPCLVLDEIRHTSDASEEDPFGEDQPYPEPSARFREKMKERAGLG